MKPIGILNFENVPADAGDPDVKVYVNGTEVSSGGGGGTSDFTECAITVINNDSNSYQLSISSYYEDEDNYKASVGEVSIRPGNNVIPVILCGGNGEALLYLSGSLIYDGVTGSDGVEFDNGSIYITGDGTLTITGED